jgi:hypothetical protein
MNILWWVFGGFELAVTHLVFALILGITLWACLCQAALKLVRWRWCPLARGSSWVQGFGCRLELRCGVSGETPRLPFPEGFTPTR